MLSQEELQLVREALKALKVERCKAIDAMKTVVDKGDPAYRMLTSEYYEDISRADDLLDKLRAA
jgi:hypothetical protein